MIIRKNIPDNKSSKSTAKNSSGKKSSIIKKDDHNLGENVKNISDNSSENKKAKGKKTKNDELAEFEKIDISSIEFKERIERRRGDRRRGYRRIDERSLVSRAQQEAHNIKELASREGYQTGLKKATDELDKLQQSLSDFMSLKDEMYEKFYPHMLEISLAIAEKIIKKEVEISPDVLKNIIISTMDELNMDTQKVEIKVNSSDYDFATAALPELIASKNDSIRMSITADDTIQKGSCIIVANNGVVDANFSTQLAVLSNAFGIYKGGM